MKYRHVFFDLDHTLWDFDRNAAEALREIYSQYALHTHGSFSDHDFIQHFLVTNSQLWDLYNSGQISQQELRDTRFPLVFKALGLDDFADCARLATDYLTISPKKPHLVPFAKEVLDFLKEKYTLHLITNGFSDMQGMKTDSAGITAYFNQVITSERAGCRKPNRQIFEYALQSARANASESIMIGDSWECDIMGARNFGIDHVYYNPKGQVCEVSPTYDIRCLSELFQILS
jgi:putative hydrolase of the HAD superfamily